MRMKPGTKRKEIEEEGEGGGKEKLKSERNVKSFNEKFYLNLLSTSFPSDSFLFCYFFLFSVPPSLIFLPFKRKQFGRNQYLNIFFFINKQKLIRWYITWSMREVYSVTKAKKFSVAKNVSGKIFIFSFSVPRHIKYNRCFRALCSNENFVRRLISGKREKKRKKRTKEQRRANDDMKRNHMEKKKIKNNFHQAYGISNVILKKRSTRYASESILCFEFHFQK